MGNYRFFSPFRVHYHHGRNVPLQQVAEISGRYHLEAGVYSNNSNMVQINQFWEATCENEIGKICCGRNAMQVEIEISILILMTAATSFKINIPVVRSEKGK